MPLCPLCKSAACHHFHTDKQRDYMRCDVCALVFVPEQYWLCAEQEKAVYDLHQNNSNDEGYRNFLSRIARPLLDKLDRPSEGLDFGCGPGPTLSKILEEAGHRVALFDIFYQPKAEVWSRDYDFISATEVFEHLHRPRFELERLWSHIRAGGYLAAMTKLVMDKAAFAQWHYKNDPTHIIFFSEETLVHLTNKWNASVELFSNDAFIFTKNK